MAYLQIKDTNWNKILQYAKYHCTVLEILAVLEIQPEQYQNRPLWREKFDTVYRRGIELGKAELRKMQWDKAKTASTAMLIWLGKQLLGQQDQVRATLQSPDGGPVQITTRPDFTKLSSEELRQLRGMLTKVHEKKGKE